MRGSEYDLEPVSKGREDPFVVCQFLPLSTNRVNRPPTGKSGRSKTDSGKRWTSEFVKDEACLEEGNCLISTSLSIIPLFDKYD